MSKIVIVTQKGTHIRGDKLDTWFVGSTNYSIRANIGEDGYSLGELWDEERFGKHPYRRDFQGDADHEYVERLDKILKEKVGPEVLGALTARILGDKNEVIYMDELIQSALDSWVGGAR